MSKEQQELEEKIRNMSGPEKLIFYGRMFIGIFTFPIIGFAMLGIPGLIFGGIIGLIIIPKG